MVRLSEPQKNNTLLIYNKFQSPTKVKYPQIHPQPSRMLMDDLVLNRPGPSFDALHHGIWSVTITDLRLCAVAVRQMAICQSSLCMLSEDV